MFSNPLYHSLLSVDLLSPAVGLFIEVFINFTVDSHVVFGLPRGLFTGLMLSCNASFVGLSSGSLNMWPSHFRRLILILLLHFLCFVLLYIQDVVTYLMWPFYLQDGS